jgi:glycosyltransferase involved in cell wall biosynthesis
MKVLLSAGMIQGGRSGVGRYVISLAEALVREHPEVELHVAGLPEDRGLFPFLKEDHWLEIPSKCSKGLHNLLWHQFKLPSILVKSDYQLVHIPSYRRMVFNSPIPQVATIHDCAPFVLREKYDFFRGFFGRCIVPVIARRMDHVVAVSETTRQDILRYMKVPGERVQTVFNGIDHQQFKPASAEAVAEFKIRKGLQRPYFVYVARLEHPAKNHLRLIEAFSQLLDEGKYDGELILPGAPWHGAEVIEQAVRASKHADRIRLAGYVENEDLPLWYAGADALIFPSLMEGFGLPLLEAQACGTLVASADATSLPEVSGPAGLLFDGLSVSSIHQRLGQIANMPQAEREHRISQGFEWAATFTWSAHANAVAAIYRNQLKKTQVA